MRNSNPCSEYGFYVKENCKIAKNCRKTNENLLKFSLNRPYFKNFYVKLSSKYSEITVIDATNALKKEKKLSATTFDYILSQEHRADVH